MKFYYFLRNRVPKIWQKSFARCSYANLENQERTELDEELKRKARQVYKNDRDRPNTRNLFFLLDLEKLQHTYPKSVRRLWRNINNFSMIRWNTSFDMDCVHLLLCFCECDPMTQKKSCLDLLRVWIILRYILWCVNHVYFSD